MMGGTVVRSSLHSCVIHEISEGVYVAQPVPGHGATSNAGIIALGDQALVFDTFLIPSAAAELRQAAEELTNSPVKLVVNSHHHLGHIGGNQVFDADTNIIATTTTRALMAESVSGALRRHDPQRDCQPTPFNLAGMSTPDLQTHEQYADHRAFLQALPTMVLRLPNVTYNQQLLIHGRDRRLEIITYGGGHTQSDSVLHLPDDGVIFLGDLLSIKRHPFLGDGDPGELPRILDLVTRLEPKSIVPGHGPIGTLADIQAMQVYLAMLTETALTELAFQFEDETELEQKVAKFTVPSPYADWQRPEFYSENLRFLYQRVMTAYADY
ncbi:MAG: MBL fold metallo-hydrolase [Caldilineaceae bacterium]